VCAASRVARYAANCAAVSVGEKSLFHEHAEFVDYMNWMLQFKRFE
jgi:hypothetical protein